MKNAKDTRDVIWDLKFAIECGDDNIEDAAAVLKEARATNRLRKAKIKRYIKKLETLEGKPVSGVLKNFK